MKRIVWLFVLTVLIPAALAAAESSAVVYAIAASPGGAVESSPRREPWVLMTAQGIAPGGATDNSAIVLSPLRGSTPFSSFPPGLRPGLESITPPGLFLEALAGLDTDDEIDSPVFWEDSLVPVFWEDSLVPVLFQRGRGRGPGFGPPPGMRRMPPPGFPPRDRGPRDGPRREGNPGNAGPRGPRPPLPPPLMEKLKDLPPEEQENVIRNNERFQQLPKEQQDRLLRRWRRFQALSPEQKEMIMKRRDAFERLTPEQRQTIRDLFPRWRALPEERHRVLQDEFRKMREMSPEERDKYLNSKDVESRFSSEERDLLKQLNSLGPLPPPPHPGPGRRFGPPSGSPPFGPPPDAPPAQPKP